MTGYFGEEFDGLAGEAPRELMQRVALTSSEEMGASGKSCRDQILLC